MNDEGALARRPRQVEHEPPREYHPPATDELVTLADFPSIACVRKIGKLEYPCARWPNVCRAGCVDEWVGLEDFALHPRRPEPA